MYYLNSRYYDPEIGRFVNADDISFLDPESINGLNLYAYCGDNPVMLTDSTGHDSWMDTWWGKTLGWITNTMLAVGAAIMIGVVAVGTVASGGLLAAVLVGAGVGILAGMGYSILSQGGLSNLSNINPWSLVAAGTIGGTIGAISGVLSFGFAQTGQVIGQQLGLAVSNFKHFYTGYKISKIMGVSTASLVKAGHIIGGILGGAIGGIYANSLAKILIKDFLGENYTFKNPNYMRSALLKLFKWLNSIK